MSKKIDLGRKFDDDIEVKSLKDFKNEKHYPTLHIDHPDAQDLPDKGSCKIHYNIVGREKSEHRGKTRHSITMEIHHLEHDGKKKEEDEDPSADARKAMDSYFEEQDKKAKK
jgi:hypothetical protein